jgi:RNA polymerase sigma factor (sigma-70 family)
MNVLREWCLIRILAKTRTVIMNHNHSVTSWLRQLETGDSEGKRRAAEELAKRYAEPLAKFIRSKIGTRLQRRVDSDDLLQETLAAFFLKQQVGGNTLNDREEFWALILTIASNKVASEARRNNAQRRDMRREQAIHGEGDDNRGEIDLPSPQRDETEMLQIAEELDALLESLPADHREVAKLLIEGYTHKEIADRVGCTTRTIERWLQQIRKVFSEMIEKQNKRGTEENPT